MKPNIWIIWSPDDGECKSEGVGGLSFDGSDSNGWWCPQKRPCEHWETCTSQIQRCIPWQWDAESENTFVLTAHEYFPTALAHCHSTVRRSWIHQTSSWGLANPRCHCLLVRVHNGRPHEAAIQTILPTSCWISINPAWTSMRICDLRESAVWAEERRGARGGKGPENTLGILRRFCKMQFEATEIWFDQQVLQECICTPTVTCDVG